MSKGAHSMKSWRNSGLFVGLVLLGAVSAWESRAAEATSLEPRFLHLRSSSVREWADYPEVAELAALDIRFQGKQNDAEQTLRLRQQGVRQRWVVQLNGKRLGELTLDEQDLLLYLPIPAGSLVDGENRLQIECPGAKPAASDDIRVGAIALDSRPRAKVLSEATLEVQVSERSAAEGIPCRITITNQDGSLPATGAVSTEELAVRAGVVYTATGRARIPLPAGNYRIYATRGFEYSLATADVSLKVDESANLKLALAREVPTQGYVACDTHIHTLTHSGHGDCTLAERLITLAGEGIELPIATDHNVAIDYRPAAAKQRLERYFTPVIGDEVTTTLGHFNVFPVLASGRRPDHTLKSWADILGDIQRTPEIKAIILNHARDIHSNTRPFGPKLHIGIAGESLEGWPFRFNAMEVINSGATQTEGSQLLQDWLALLNRGYHVTPVGSSDSHDVTRYIVGQGRTYIRSDDRDVSAIDTQAAIENFVCGRVNVSYGLLTALTVNGRFGPGEIAPCSDEEMEVALQVLGPSWTQAERVQLFANGILLREEAIAPRPAERSHDGVHWHATWKFPRPKQDVHVVAVAWGPEVTAPYWPTARPYQPTSPIWKGSTLGISGAVWLDGDRDGKQSSAFEYATRLFAEEGGDFAKVTRRLADYDTAVAIQAASWYRRQGGKVDSEAFAAQLESAPPAAQAGFRAYRDAWRESERARALP